jgi:hypothetical protein
LRRYSSLTSAFWSIVRSLMGDYEYAPVAQANVLLGPLLYWSWQILCQIIFLNMIIAAFCEEFAKILMRVRSAPFFLCCRCDNRLNLYRHRHRRHHHVLQDGSSKEKTMFDVVGEFDVFKRAQVRSPPYLSLPMKQLLHSSTPFFLSSSSTVAQTCVGGVGPGCV